MEEDDDKIWCKACNAEVGMAEDEDTFYIEFEVAECDHIICRRCLTTMKTRECPACETRFPWLFMSMYMNMFDNTILYGNNRQAQIDFNAIITTDDDDERDWCGNFTGHDSFSKKKIRKDRLDRACTEKLGYFWECVYDPHDIENIIIKLKDNKEKTMPNKIFIYGSTYAIMFERTDESESLFYEYIVEHLFRY